VERGSVFGARSFGLGPVVTVGFIDDYSVDHFHDSALYHLQFVACAGQHEQQKKVADRVNGGFRLADANCLNEDIAVSGRLAEKDRFAGAGGYATELSGRGRRPNEGAFVRSEPSHSGLVSKDAAARDGAGGIDAEDGYTFAEAARYMDAKGIDERTLAHSGSAADTEPAGLSDMGNESIQQLHPKLGIGRKIALNQCDGLGENRAIRG